MDFSDLVASICKPPKHTPYEHPRRRQSRVPGRASTLELAEAKYTKGFNSVETGAYSPIEDFSRVYGVSSDVDNPVVYGYNDGPRQSMDWVDAAGWYDEYHQSLPLSAYSDPSTYNQGVYAWRAMAGISQDSRSSYGEVGGWGKGITRTLGVMQTLGGVAQVGGAYALGWTGFGLVLAPMGLDNINSGLRATWTGKHTPTYLNRGLRTAGMSHRAADGTEFVANIAVPAGPGLARALGYFKNSYSRHGFFGMGNTAKQTAELHVLQPGLSEIPLARTKGLGETSTTEELLRTGAIPGTEGVILKQRAVPFQKIWEMSEKAGVEFVLTRENGSFVLRSGSPISAPIPKGVRPIVHSHPKNQFGINSLFPSPADINVLNLYWSKNPYLPRPVSQILAGESLPTKFYATGFEELSLKYTVMRGL